MCIFYNIQPNDIIIIENSNFNHAYCEIYFGSNDNNTNNGTFTFENNTFSYYESSFILGIYDLPYNGSYRNKLYLKNNVFENANINKPIIDINILSIHPIIFENNRFINNTITNIIKFEYSYIDNNIDRPNINLISNKFIDNTCNNNSSLIYLFTNNEIINKTQYPLINGNLNIFENNIIENSIFDIIQIEYD